MAVIQVAKVEQKESNFGAMGLLGMLCYYYPQYTLAQARKLPFKHVNLLLRIARREKAGEYLNLLQITASQHSKQGKGMSKLSNEFERIYKHG